MQGKTGNLNRPLTNEEIEVVIKNNLHTHTKVLAHKSSSQILSNV